jgi:hypothetical protein
MPIATNTIDEKILKRVVKEIIKGELSEIFYQMVYSKEAGMRLHNAEKFTKNLIKCLMNGDIYKRCHTEYYSQ